jgi:NTP pyrophosphatase (non-canonical NTP hydrolase)
MDFDEYQREAQKTAMYPALYLGTTSETSRQQSGMEGLYELRYVYPTLGLAGEAGEVAEKVKKVIRNQNGILPMSKFDKDRYELISKYNPRLEHEKVITQEDIDKELGDLLWYISDLAGIWGLSLEEIAFHNIAKLNSRQERGTIASAGDNR